MKRDPKIFAVFLVVLVLSSGVVYNFILDKSLATQGTCERSQFDVNSLTVMEVVQPKARILDQAWPATQTVTVTQMITKNAFSYVGAKPTEVQETCERVDVPKAYLTMLALLPALLVMFLLRVFLRFDDDDKLDLRSAGWLVALPTVPVMVPALSLPLHVPVMFVVGFIMASAMIVAWAVKERTGGDLMTIGILLSVSCAGSFVFSRLSTYDIVTHGIGIIVSAVVLVLVAKKLLFKNPNRGNSAAQTQTKEV